MDELLQLEADLERLEFDAKRMLFEISNQFCGDASSTNRQQAIQSQATSTVESAKISEIGDLLDGIMGQLKRIADHFDPMPAPLVGSPYIAERLGCTTYWVTQMVRRREMPSSCVVPGTGNGKPWKFFRSRVDDWLKTR